jgi:hypothetical protein
MTWLEVIEPAQHVQRTLLDDVACVEVSSGRGRKPAVRPSLERWQTPFQQRFDGEAVSALRPNHQLDGRLVAYQRVIRLIDGFGCRLHATPRWRRRHALANHIGFSCPL